MQLIVCETTGDWAAELWRRLPSGISLMETRSLPEVWQQLDSRPTMVALELTPQRAEQLLAALVRINREFPSAVAIVLADRSLAGWEEIVRHAGAVHFIASRRNVDELIELVRHRMASPLIEHFPPNDNSNSLEDQILASLPWGD
jgi:hypothetical protein